MGLKKLSKSKKRKINIFFKIFAVISTIIAIIFSVLLFALNMVPFKYLIIIYVTLFMLYFILLFLVFKSKIKIIVKICCIVFFIVFDLIFAIGIKYISKTINFVDVINNKISQKEEYYVMSLSNSGSTIIDELANKKIGIYKTINSQNAADKLKVKISYNDTEFIDITEMFDVLEEGGVAAVLINASMKNLLETEYKDLYSRLKEIYKIDVEIQEKDDIVKVVDVTRQPFNIYVAGGDAYGSIGNVTNTDVNMIVTVDPVNKKLLLTSIPRDYYVNLPSFGEEAYDKLTHAGYYGIEESVQAVEKLLDIDINYYVKVNFSTIEGVIDAIGGVDVYVDKGFLASDEIYTFTTGINHMNGAKALSFARERKVFPDGDVQRVKNQQKVFSAIVDKVSSSTSIITNFSSILDSVSSNFSTNLDSKSINRLVKMQLSDMVSWEIEKQNLLGTDYYTKETYTFPGVNLYVMKKSDESVNVSSKKIEKYLNNK